MIMLKNPDYKCNVPNKGTSCYYKNGICENCGNKKGWKLKAPGFGRKMKNTPKGLIVLVKGNPYPSDP
jgi:hypothetical protein